MITVSIAINGRAIYTRSARNITEEYCDGKYGQGLQTYKMDSGEIINHSYEDGAIKLATIMLSQIEEV